jgi:hypothetical protein
MAELIKRIAKKKPALELLMLKFSELNAGPDGRAQRIRP